ERERRPRRPKQNQRGAGGHRIASGERELRSREPIAAGPQEAIVSRRGERELRSREPIAAGPQEAIVSRRGSASSARASPSREVQGTLPGALPENTHLPENLAGCPGIAG